LRSFKADQELNSGNLNHGICFSFQGSQRVFLTAGARDRQTSKRQEMPRILESIEINASRDRVWGIISNLDDEPEYWWGTRTVRNLLREGNVIEREIYQNFGNHAVLQKVILKPQDEIEFEFVKGLTEGSKILRLESMESGQRLSVDWNVHFTGIYRLTSPIVSGHVRKGTRDALQRIKDVSEGREIKPRPVRAAK
jgi:hypothetical protein